MPLLKRRRPPPLPLPPLSAVLPASLTHPYPAPPHPLAALTGGPIGGEDPLLLTGPMPEEQELYEPTERELVDYYSTHGGAGWAGRTQKLMEPTGGMGIAGLLNEPAVAPGAGAGMGGMGIPTVMQEYPHPFPHHLPPAASFPAVPYTNGHGHGNGNGVVGEGGSQRMGERESQRAEKEKVEKVEKVVEPEVWFLKETGEVFLEYEQYLNRIAFYRQKVFQCEVTNKANLTYFQALTSELHETKELHSKFPEVLKKVILECVQWAVEGRLDDLTDKVFDRFKERYFPNEKVFVEIANERYFANIAQAVPPRTLPPSPHSRRKNLGAPSSSSSSSSSVSSAANARARPHWVGTDLQVDEDDADDKDPADGYMYRCQLITAMAMASGAKAGDGGEVFGTNYVMIKPQDVHRDRTHFNKVMLKRFLKDCLDRDPAVYSPWLIKDAVAEKFGINQVMSEDVRVRLETDREAKMDKRRRGMRGEIEEEEVEEKPAKKQKLDKETKVKREKMTKEERKEERKKDKERQKEQERLAKEQEAAEREEADMKKRKKPTKFPCEDLYLELTDREKKLGMPIQRVELVRRLPFPGDFETFLTSWSFLNSMGIPLGLAPFTIDEFEQALYHNNPDVPCTLLIETHATLLNVLIKEAQIPNQPAVYPLKAFGPLGLDEREDGESSLGDEDGVVKDDDEDAEEKQEKMEVVHQEANEYAHNWTLKELSAKTGRKGWEGALIGCLWSRAIIKTLPNLLNYAQGILLEDTQAPTGRPTWSSATMRPRITKRLDQRYIALHSTFKLEIIAFLCELVMQTRLIRDFMDDSVKLLTNCRNDQTEAKREFKRAAEERHALDPKEEMPEANGNGHVDMDVDMDAGSMNGRGSHEPSTHGNGTEHDELDDSRSSPSMEGDNSMSDTASGSGRGSRTNGRPAVKATTVLSRQLALQAKKAQVDAENAARAKVVAEEREESRQKKAEGRNLSEQKKRLDEEIETFQAKIFELEREFRRQFYTLRCGPVGQDRYGNRCWWLDGCGSATLYDANGEVVYGTGRLYIQGPPEGELELRAENLQLDMEELKQKRLAEEGEEGQLAPGEWAIIDDVEKLEEWMRWLNPKGYHENSLIKYLNKWSYAIKDGMTKRQSIMAPIESQRGDSDLPTRRARVPIFKGKDAYLAYKNEKPV